MEIHIAYCSDLTVWISFLAGFSFWNFFPMSQCLSVESRPLRAGSTWLFFWALTCFITLVSHFCGDHKFSQVSAKCWRSVRQVSARYQWTEKLCWPTYISTDCQSSVDGHSTEWQQSIDLVLTATSTDIAVDITYSKHDPNYVVFQEKSLSTHFICITLHLCALHIPWAKLETISDLCVFNTDCKNSCSYKLQKTSLRTMEGPLVIIMILEKNIAPSLPALPLFELMNSLQNFEKNEDLKSFAIS